MGLMFIRDYDVHFGEFEFVDYPTLTQRCKNNAGVFGMLAQMEKRRTECNHWLLQRS